jgi:glycosyltransferase involved in cell wall biosynthesis
MRIAIIGSRGFPYVYSGYETFVAHLAPELVARGHHVTVYCHRGLFKERPLVVRGVHLRYIPAIEHKILSQFTNSLLATLHAVLCYYDVIFYVNSANGPFGLLTKLFRKKTAINVDGLEWLRPKWKGLGSRYFRFASFLATRFFDVVVTDSERMAEIYKLEFNSPSVTITYGADIGYSTNVSLIHSFGLKPHEYYLIVGRLIPDNNAELIVRAFEQIHTKKNLVILGGVPYKDIYAESIRQTKDPRIIFPGYVRDAECLKELYCNAYCYIHGHEFGGTNPALLKALAYGCCVLALDTMFNREVLSGEKYGFYFSKSEANVVQWLEFLERNKDLVEEKRSIARNRILESYTWDHIIDQYESLFHKLSKQNN